MSLYSSRLPHVRPLIRIWITYCFLGLSTVVFWTCAAVQSPPGGPKDTTPPVLLDAQPPNESVQVTDTRFRFVFSEYLQESSLANGIQIFPRPNQLPTLIYDDDAFEVILHDTLRPNQTYIITLTRQITDEHQVALAQDIQYAFSTGPTIDRGMITGQITSKTEASVHLWRVTEPKDSLFFTFPDYVARCDEDGQFQFGYLSPGSYRLLAVEKSGTGVPLNVGMTAYGLPHLLTIQVNSDTVGPYHIRLHRETPPLIALKGIRYPGGWAEISFNTTPRPLPRVFSPSGDPIPGLADPRDSLRIVLFETNLPDTVRILPVGMSTEKTQILAMTMPEEADTQAVTLFSPGKVLSFRPELDAEPTVRLVFTKPLEPITSPADLPLLYTRKDSILFESLVKQESPFVITVKPFQDWEPNTEYFLTCPGAGLMGRDSTTFQDSVLLISISTGPAVGYGSLSGSVTGSNASPVGITLSSVENSGKSVRKVVNSPSTFHLDDLPEGAYLLSIFSDRDLSETYSFGRVYPPQAAEYFRDYPDTVSIRAHWETVLPPITIQEP